jgi:hypothetical protein
MAVTNRLDINARGLILRDQGAKFESVTIKKDAARAIALAPYTVLGRSRSTVATTGTLTPVGSANGTCTAVAKIGGGPALIPGDYTLECTAAVANGGIFQLADPNGVILASNLAMTAGSGAATIFTVAGLTFTLTDGSEDFDDGDVFAITVTADGDYTPLLVDGLSGIGAVEAIYMGPSITAAALVAADITDCLILKGGLCVVEEAAVVLENSLTLASVLQSGLSVEEELNRIGIFVQAVIDADGYENS